MKNTTTKHQNIEHSNNLKEGKYALQYTTCPEKSYLVAPDEGAIDYNKMTIKNTHKFVEKIINGEVELFEIEE